MITPKYVFSGHSLKGWYEVFLQIGGDIIVQIKQNIGMISLLNFVKDSYTFAKFIMELVALALKSSCVGYPAYFVPMFDPVLGFAAALSAKLQLEIQFVRKFIYPNYL